MSPAARIERDHDAAARVAAATPSASACSASAWIAASRVSATSPPAVAAAGRAPALASARRRASRSTGTRRGSPRSHASSSCSTPRTPTPSMFAKPSTCAASGAAGRRAAARRGCRCPGSPSACDALRLLLVDPARDVDEGRPRASFARSARWRRAQDAGASGAGRRRRGPCTRRRDRRRPWAPSTLTRELLAGAIDDRAALGAGSGRRRRRLGLAAVRAARGRSTVRCAARAASSDEPRTSTQLATRMRDASCGGPQVFGDLKARRGPLPARRGSSMATTRSGRAKPSAAAELGSRTGSRSSRTSHGQSGACARGALSSWLSDLAEPRSARGSGSRRAARRAASAASDAARRAIASTHARERAARAARRRRRSRGPTRSTRARAAAARRPARPRRASAANRRARSRRPAARLMPPPASRSATRRRAERARGLRAHLASPGRTARRVTRAQRGRAPAACRRACSGGQTQPRSHRRAAAASRRGPRASGRRSRRAARRAAARRIAASSASASAPSSSFTAMRSAWKTSVAGWWRRPRADAARRDHARADRARCASGRAPALSTIARASRRGARAARRTRGTSARARLRRRRAAAPRRWSRRSGPCACRAASRRRSPRRSGSRAPRRRAGARRRRGRAAPRRPRRARSAASTRGQLAEGRAAPGRPARRRGEPRRAALRAPRHRGRGRAGGRRARSARGSPRRGRRRRPSRPPPRRPGPARSRARESTRRGGRAGRGGQLPPPSPRGSGERLGCPGAPTPPERKSPPIDFRPTATGTPETPQPLNRRSRSSGPPTFESSTTRAARRWLEISARDPGSARICLEARLAPRSRCARRRRRTSPRARDRACSRSSGGIRIRPWPSIGHSDRAGDQHPAHACTSGWTCDMRLEALLDRLPVVVGVEPSAGWSISVGQDRGAGPGPGVPCGTPAEWRRDPWSPVRVDVAPRTIGWDPFPSRCHRRGSTYHSIPTIPTCATLLLHAHARCKQKMREPCDFFERLDQLNKSVVDLRRQLQDAEVWGCVQAASGAPPGAQAAPSSGIAPPVDRPPRVAPAGASTLPARHLDRRHAAAARAPSAARAPRSCPRARPLARVAALEREHEAAAAAALGERAHDARHREEARAASPPSRRADRRGARRTRTTPA